MLRWHQADKRVLSKAVAIAGSAATRTRRSGIEQAYLVETVAVTSPAPVHMEVTAAVLHLIAIDDKGMAAAGGRAPIHQGTAFAQFIVEQLVPPADGVVVSIGPIDTLVIAEQLDKHVYIVKIATGFLWRVIHLNQLSAIAHQRGDGRLLHVGSRLIVVIHHVIPVEGRGGQSVDHTPVGHRIGW